MRKKKQNQGSILERYRGRQISTVEDKLQEYNEPASDPIRFVWGMEKLQPLLCRRKKYRAFSV